MVTPSDAPPKATKNAKSRVEIKDNIASRLRGRFVKIKMKKDVVEEKKKTKKTVNPKITNNQRTPTKPCSGRPVTYGDALLRPSPNVIGQTSPRRIVLVRAPNLQGLHYNQHEFPQMQDLGAAAPSELCHHACRQFFSELFNCSPFDDPRGTGRTAFPNLFKTTFTFEALNLHSTYTSLQGKHCRLLQLNVLIWIKKYDRVLKCYTVWTSRKEYFELTNMEIATQKCSCDDEKVDLTKLSEKETFLLAMATAACESCSDNKENLELLLKAMYVPRKRELLQPAQTTTVWFVSLNQCIIRTSDCETHHVGCFNYSNDPVNMEVSSAPGHTVEPISFIINGKKPAKMKVKRTETGDHGLKVMTVIARSRETTQTLNIILV